MCVFVCVCVCAHIFVTNEDINLYNDTGDFSGHCPMSPFFKMLINHTE